LSGSFWLGTRKISRSRARLLSSPQHQRFHYITGQYETTPGPCAPPDLIVRSPGRVNLLGEHTDYNDGWALPIALDMGTDFAMRRRNDRTLRVAAPRFGTEDQVSLDQLRPQEGPEWTRYVRGVAALLGEAGCDLDGADILIGGDLPVAAGLSSSASLELGIAAGLMTLAGQPIDRVALAQLGQRVENEIVGVQSGILDQLAVAGGVAGQALLIDCRTLGIEPVPLPQDVRVLVLESGVSRTLATSAYNRRRAECESALGTLSSIEPDLKALRDVNPKLLADVQQLLGDVELRRARHVITENQRVLDAVDALRSTDADTFGLLMTASHASLRDDYEVSVPELDTLVDIAVSVPGVLGARMTGAGFGGCAVALVRTEAAVAAMTTITERYRMTTGHAGSGYICSPDDGVRVRWAEG
ncbi:galactokinase, partial [Micromonospora sp. B11E3]|uniref:galactokinase n=1 Tax=Micromonospora sp. B11E3 TaxID=3153562 RepID=UPI00325CC371